MRWVLLQEPGARSKARNKELGLDSAPAVANSGQQWVLHAKRRH